MTKRGYCANKSMVPQQSSGTKCMLKHGPQGLQNPARHVPEPSKIEAWSAPGNENVPKIHPRPTKRRPRAPKKRPRCAQGAPKRGQEPPKSAQSWPSDVQEAPNMAPDPSKIESGEPQDEFVARSWLTRLGTNSGEADWGSGAPQRIVIILDLRSE